MKLTIGITVDTEAKNGIVLDSTCDGTEAQVEISRRLTTLFGELLRCFVEDVTGRPMLDAQEEEVSANRTVQ